MSVAEHRAHSPASVACFVLTVSDTRTLDDRHQRPDDRRSARSAPATPSCDRQIVQRRSRRRRSRSFAARSAARPGARHHHDRRHGHHAPRLDVRGRHGPLRQAARRLRRAVPHAELPGDRLRGDARRARPRAWRSGCAHLHAARDPKRAVRLGDDAAHPPRARPCRPGTRRSSRRHDDHHAPNHRDPALRRCDATGDGRRRGRSTARRRVPLLDADGRVAARDVTAADGRAAVRSRGDGRLRGRRRRHVRRGHARREGADARGSRVHRPGADARHRRRRVHRDRDGRADAAGRGRRRHGRRDRARRRCASA